MARLKMYTEELLAACLTFVLSVPPEVSRENVVQIVSALQVICNDIGLVLDHIYQ